MPMQKRRGADLLMHLDRAESARRADPPDLRAIARRDSRWTAARGRSPAADATWRGTLASPASPSPPPLTGCALKATSMGALARARSSPPPSPTSRARTSGLCATHHITPQHRPAQRSRAACPADTVGAAPDTHSARSPVRRRARRYDLRPGVGAAELFPWARWRRVVGWPDLAAIRPRLIRAMPPPAGRWETLLGPLETRDGHCGLAAALAGGALRSSAGAGGGQRPADSCAAGASACRAGQRLLVEDPSYVGFHAAFLAEGAELEAFLWMSRDYGLARFQSRDR